MALFFSLRQLLSRFRKAPSRNAIRARTGRRLYRLALDELEARLAPATVQFNTTSEVLLDTSGAFSIPITLSAAVNQPVSVPYTILSNAIAGVDYTGLSKPTGHSRGANLGGHHGHLAQ